MSLPHTPPCHPVSSRPARPPFEVLYADPAQAAQVADSHLLASIGYSPVGGVADPRRPWRFAVALEQLGGAHCELWLSPEPVRRGQHGQIGYSCNRHVLLAWTWLEEAEFGGIDAATRRAYQEIGEFSQRCGYPHLLRVWNYLPDINCEQQTVERYQHFCVGRYAAIDTSPGFEHALPAATAIGTHAGGLLIYWLAAREAGAQIENPRQISAFRYPPQYSPKTPVFSRALLKRWDTHDDVYISGTASIVGHRTRYPYATAPQLREILRNLEQLARQARQRGAAGLSDLSRLTLLKVYLRRRADFAPLHAQLARTALAQVPTVYLLGDVCRGDLMVELEALYSGVYTGDNPA